MRDNGISAREAVKMVGECSRERLPYVLAILKREGYEFPDCAVELANMDRMDKEERTAEKRKRSPKKWMRTDAQEVALLRKAYMRGISFTAVSRMSGINRTVMYEYLKGTRQVPEFHKQTLAETLEKLLDSNPDGKVKAVNEDADG